MVNRIQQLDKDGQPVGKAQYGLYVTHDEIHLIFWAVRLAESMQASSPAALQDLFTYQSLRSELTDKVVDQFIDKFDAVHALAREDDGE